MYVYDTNNNNCGEKYSFVQFLQTVHENKKLMTKREREHVKYARSVQEYLGWPSTKDFMDMIGGNNILNIDLTLDDIK